MADLPRPVPTIALRARRLVAAWSTIALVGLVAGCALVGPDGATDASAGASPLTSPSPGAAASTTPVPSITPVPSPTPLSYVVRAGDTLLAIAKRYDTSARSIAYWNRVTYPSLDPESSKYKPDSIQVGWTLVIHPGQEVDEASPPPGPSPTPVPSLQVGPGVTPRPDGTSLVVDHGSRDGNAVALTFDLDGAAAAGLDTVDWLVDHAVPATVFLTGEAAGGQDGAAILAVVAAHPDLFSIGNAGWDGSDLTKLDATGIADQLARTDGAIDAVTGRSTKPFMRPAAGLQDIAVRTAAGGGGWTYTVLWDVDPSDRLAEVDGGPTADDLTARVVARSRGGSIVLLHFDGVHTLEALPGIVDGLRDRGLEPVTLDRLLGTG